MSSLYDKCVPMINALLYTKPYPSSSPTSIAQTLTVAFDVLSRHAHTPSQFMHSAGRTSITARTLCDALGFARVRIVPD